MEPIEWRPVVGYEDRYEVSNVGHVRNARTGYVLSPATSKRYPYVNLGGKTHKVHRLVAIAFLGDQGPTLHVCHNNGNPFDNRLANLRWDTASSNVADAIKHGVHPAAKKMAVTHCPSGHEYTPENTYTYPSGYRYCRSCRKANARRDYEAKKARLKTAA